MASRKLNETLVLRAAGRYDGWMYSFDRQHSRRASQMCANANFVTISYFALILVMVISQVANAAPQHKKALHWAH